MQEHIPTIQELKRKSERELRAIFRVAISASIASPSPTEREAARQTVITVKLVLHIPGLH